MCSGSEAGAFISGEAVRLHMRGKVPTLPWNPGGSSGANLKSISHGCYLREVAFQWKLTKETVYLPLCCLQGGLLLFIKDAPADVRRSRGKTPERRRSRGAFMKKWVL